MARISIKNAENAGTIKASPRCRYAEIMILCARLGFNP